MGLNRDKKIDQIKCQIDYAKFINSQGVFLSAECAQFCLNLALTNKELTEENERLRADVIAKEVEYDDMLHQRNSVEQHLETAVADTVSKMQERLLDELYKIAKVRHGDEPNMKSPEVFRIIDQITKEMLEAANAHQMEQTK